MNYFRLSAKFVLVCSFTLMVACGSDESDSRGGIEGAFSSQAVWESSCLDSDRFGLTMLSRFEIEGQAFRRVNQYFSDGTCRDVTIETVEEGSLLRTQAADGSASGDIDLNYNRIDIQPVAESGILALNTVTYCGLSNWQIRQARNVTQLSGGNCWDRTPRTVRDIYFVEGNNLYFGVGSEKQKIGAASRPTAPDQNRVWKIK